VAPRLVDLLTRCGVATLDGRMVSQHSAGLVEQSATASTSKSRSSSASLRRRSSAPTSWPAAAQGCQARPLSRTTVALSPFAKKGTLVGAFSARLKTAIAARAVRFCKRRADQVPKLRTDRHARTLTLVALLQARNLRHRLTYPACRVSGMAMSHLVASGGKETTPSSMTRKPNSTATKDSRPRSNRSRAGAIAAPSEDALDLLSRANRRAKQRKTPIRNAFIASDRNSHAHASDDPPLALLLHATKGGALRLKFYLAVLWQAGGGDERHTVTWPARAWAALLDLPDPGRRGDRRVREAIRALERAHLLTAGREPGQPIQLSLRSDDGRDEPYTHPGAAAHAAKEAGEFDLSKHGFVQLPPSFWTQGWAIVLSGPGVAMLLVMLMLTENGAKTQIWIAPPQARSRFGLSEDTWTRGVAELRRHGVLEVRRKPVSPDFGWGRVRNTYTLNRDRLEEDPLQASQPDSPERKPAPSRSRVSAKVKASAGPRKKRAGTS
jgi:hypothetical protein